MSRARSVLPPLVALVVLLATTLYWLDLGSRGLIADRDPEVGPGEHVLSFYEVTATVDADHYRVRRPGGREIVITGPTAGLAPGEIVTIRVLAEGGERIELWRAEHPDREDKMWLGVVGVVFLGVAAPFWFGVRDRRLVSRG